MIGYLEGKVIYSDKDKLILFTNGIGFTVFCPSSLRFLENQTAKLYIHTHLREDNLALYGFASPTDLSLFEQLISVSGVGPRIALSIFSTASIENIKKAIQSSDLSFFTSISGVGKKTSQKIILDLKNKIGHGDVDLNKLDGASELLDSLTALGFQKPEILSIVSKVDTSGTIAEQVKSALKLLRS